MKNIEELSARDALNYVCRVGLEPVFPGIYDGFLSFNFAWTACDDHNKRNNHQKHQTLVKWVETNQSLRASHFPVEEGHVVYGVDCGLHLLLKNPVRFCDQLLQLRCPAVQLVQKCICNTQIQGFTNRTSPKTFRLQTSIAHCSPMLVVFQASVVRPGWKCCAALST